MPKKTKTSLVTATLVVAGIGAGAAVASAASNPPGPAAQPAGSYVFACVNTDGKIDYLEFRKPLPHQCWHSGETLWYWAVVPGPTASPSASASATPSASPSASATPSASPSASASPSLSPSPSPSPSASSS